MKCCICGKEIKGHGHNPSPLKDVDGSYFEYEDRCCDECNDSYVCEIRLAQLLKDEKKEKLIQNQVDRVKGVIRPKVKHLIAVIERPDGTCYTQEIDYLNDSIKDSIKNAQALLGNPYYFSKDENGKKVKHIKSNAYLIIDAHLVEED